MSSILQWQNIVFLVEYAILACIFVFVLYLLGTMRAQAVPLHIIGHSTIQGLHILAFTGDQLNASILQGINGISWQITAGGWT